jgi:MoaA/NifB/PqqE/SkfB family radical SAM enzyme
MPAPWPVQLALGFATSFLPGWDRRFATFEMSRFCNRRCSYCRVPDLHVPEEDLTLDEAKRVVNWLAARGYRILSCIGGEPLANVKLREGLTFTEYHPAGRSVCHSTRHVRQRHVQRRLRHF